MLDREGRLPAELMSGSLASLEEEFTSYGDYVDRRREKLQRAHFVAHKNIWKSAVTQKNRYGRCPKLEPVYIGPFVVVR